MHSAASVRSAAPRLAYVCARCSRTRAHAPLPISASRAVSTATPRSSVSALRPAAASRLISTTHRRQASSTTTSDSSADARDSPSASAAAPRTHYDLFPSTLPSGPPPAGPFSVDARALRREFLQLQAKAHPDLFPPGPSKTRAEAASAVINEAYRTLVNPLLRAQYILSLRGVDVANDETLQVQDPALLGLVLEAREEVDDAESEADLEEPRRVNDARIAESEEALELAFKRDDIDAAKEEAMKMRYWVNIKDSLDNWEKEKPFVLQH